MCYFKWVIHCIKNQIREKNTVLLISLSSCAIQECDDVTYGLLTKCEVKMARHWPSSFFASLWTETKSRYINSQKKNEANIQPS